MQIPHNIGSCVEDKYTSPCDIVHINFLFHPGIGTKLSIAFGFRLQYLCTGTNLQAFLLWTEMLELRMEEGGTRAKCQDVAPDNRPLNKNETGIMFDLT
ncbi:predicted protein [Sclerotinia sclerotiorum 1980 UF-70]|uniref:Uncharacterized protein n=1 Tax=Sclerotinia sclerotiorum (strain ATCC 18683 / 1980 / Ss-1) TaxID=665079 RepID=A7FA00_SCLS1|nr:predicted protein [Sclerotinia sclerotiorum 1980 UF-70]EDO00561.1 predicted protein [Sclerotinia sclerotiorum 1980 UF-70]